MQDETGNLEQLGVCQDVHELFVQFDILYFKTVLSNTAVKLEWSNRMTRCAGLCELKRDGTCTIRLSSKLLQYRTPQNVRETLAHEMIHAYLFRLGVSDSRDGHGPAFCEKMVEINQDTGLNITVYHDFYDEVAFLQGHVWKCNGACVSRPPYYGVIKRSMNRAPSRRDPWFRSHELSCGGLFVKIKSPEPKKTKITMPKKEKELTKKTKTPIQNNTITSYMSPNKKDRLSRMSSPKKRVSPIKDMSSEQDQVYMGEFSTKRPKLLSNETTSSSETEGVLHVSKSKRVAICTDDEETIMSVDVDQGDAELAGEHVGERGAIGPGNVLGKAGLDNNLLVPGGYCTEKGYRLICRDGIHYVLERL